MPHFQTKFPEKWLSARQSRQILMPRPFVCIILFLCRWVDVYDSDQQLSSSFKMARCRFYWFLTLAFQLYNIYRQRRIKHYDRKWKIKKREFWNRSNILELFPTLSFPFNIEWHPSWISHSTTKIIAIHFLKYYSCHPHAKNKVSIEIHYFCGNFSIFLEECGMSAWLVWRWTLVSTKNRCVRRDGF